MNDTKHLIQRLATLCVLMEHDGPDLYAEWEATITALGVKARVLLVARASLPDTDEDGEEIPGTRSDKALTIADLPFGEFATVEDAVRAVDEEIGRITRGRRGEGVNVWSTVPNPPDYWTRRERVRQQNRVLAADTRAGEEPTKSGDPLQPSPAHALITTKERTELEAFRRVRKETHADWYAKQHTPGCTCPCCLLARVGTEAR